MPGSLFNTYLGLLYILLVSLLRKLLRVCQTMRNYLIKPEKKKKKIILVYGQIEKEAN